MSGLVAGSGAGGGSYGGSVRTLRSQVADQMVLWNPPHHWGTYGNINVDALLAGSGGGGGWMAKGGPGAVRSRSPPVAH